MFRKWVLQKSMPIADTSRFPDGSIGLLFANGDTARIKPVEDTCSLSLIIQQACEEALRRHNQHIKIIPADHPELMCDDEVAEEDADNRQIGGRCPTCLRKIDYLEDK